MPPSDAPRPELTALYQELILDHYRRPRNRGTLGDEAVSVAMRNPLCGDEITLQLAFDGDVVRDVRFSGQGCAISQASASMMTQALKGKTRGDADAIARRFNQMIAGDVEAAGDKSLGELRALAGVARIPVRVKCALLAWQALERGMAREPGTHGDG